MCDKLNNYANFDITKTSNDLIVNFSDCDLINIISKPQQNNLGENDIIIDIDIYIEKESITPKKLLQNDNLVLSNKIKRLRKVLLSLCYLLLDIIPTDLSKKDSDKRNYIDDILLWVFVKEEISILQYKQKIDELTNIYNNIVKN
mgnify:CR=1 FL=1